MKLTRQTTRPLAIRKDGTWYAYGWDLTKNVTEVFGPAGYIRTTYTYTPYGEATTTGDVTQPFTWSSEYADEELGLIYYNYRHYNSTDGRWINRDPIEERGNLNAYVYVENQSIESYDLLGLFLDTIWDVGNMVWDVGKIVAGVVTGNAELRNEGATDLALDAIAAAIPGLPAGGSKVERAAKRAAKRSAKQAKKDVARRAKKVEECLSLHARYHAVGDHAGSCNHCSNCDEIIKTLTNRGLEVRLRRKFLEKGCDYYLEGSLIKGIGKAIEDHKDQIKEKRDSFAKCFKIAVQKHCTNLPSIAL